MGALALVREAKQADGGGYGSSADKHPHAPAGSPTGGQFAATNHTAKAKPAQKATPKTAAKAVAKPAAKAAPALPPPPTTARTMKLGQSGDDVHNLQYAMGLLGFNVPQDGVFDAHTQAAVAQAQARLGMKPNGHATGSLLRKMQDAVRLSPCVKESRIPGPVQLVRIARTVERFDPAQPRDDHGRWSLLGEAIALLRKGGHDKAARHLEEAQTVVRRPKAERHSRYRHDVIDADRIRTEAERLDEQHSARLFPGSRMEDPENRRLNRAQAAQRRAELAPLESRITAHEHFFGTEPDSADHVGTAQAHVDALQASRPTSMSDLAHELDGLSDVEQRAKMSQMGFSAQETNDLLGPAPDPTRAKFIADRPAADVRAADARKLATEQRAADAKGMSLEEWRASRTPSKAVAKVTAAKKVAPAKAAKKAVPKAARPNPTDVRTPAHGTEKLDGNWRAYVEGRLAAGERLTDPATDEGPHGDELAHAIAETQGFDGPPSLVTSSELDSAISDGALPLHRSFSGDTELGHTGSDFADQFRTGHSYFSFGRFGSGVYTSIDPKVASDFGSRDPAVVRMALRKDAKVITWRALVKEKEDWFASQWPDYRYDEDAVRLLSDNGRFAAAQGYDAIMVDADPGVFRLFGQTSVDDHVIILNRTALLVERPDSAAAPAKAAKKAATKAPRATKAAKTGLGRAAAPSRAVAKVTAARKAAPAAPAVSVTKGELTAMATREQAAAALVSMKKPELLALATEMSIPRAKSRSAVDLRKAIVEATVGDRLDHEARLNGSPILPY